MKYRDVYTVPARIEERTRIKRAWKDESGAPQSETESLGWFIVLVFGGNEFAFYHGPEKPGPIKSAATVSIEFETL